MIIESLEEENHLLLDFPFAKQEGEQVTHTHKTGGEKDQELVSFYMAAETQ